MAANWIYTHCARFDHGGCGLRALVEDGKLIKLEPNPDDPFSRGYSCPKGMASLERINNPARLTFPLKRKGARGAGEWQTISWDEALSMLVEQFSSTIEEFGPEAAAFAQGAPKGLEFFMLLRLANLLKIPNVAGSQHVCHMPREQMAMVTCGFFPVADLESPTQCVLLWGSNPLNTNEEGVLGVHLMESLRHSPTLIVVDPVRTELAKRADVWLQIRPGSDDLLAMGFLHVILEEKLFDADFVNEWTTGFEDLCASVKPYTPEIVAQGTWLERDSIIEAARLYGRSRPALIQWGNAVEHTINSSQTSRTLVLLMAVTGNLERPGGNIRTQAPKLRPLRDFICLDHFPDRPQKLLNRHFGLIPRLITIPGWTLIHSIIDQSPYPIRCLYTQGTNPLVSYAQTEEVRQALSKLDFIAVADQVMTPTAALADLVLPVATHLEYSDIGHYGLPHGYVLARPKAVEPRDQCWSDLKILNEWGKRMGLAEHFWTDPDQALEYVLEPSGLSYAEFVHKGMLKGKKPFFSYHHKGFSTPSGKVELKSSLLEKWGYLPLPSPSEPNGEAADYPLILTSAKPKYYFHSAYRHLGSLRKRHPSPRFLVHPETARALGIGEGERVCISTRYGSMSQEAHIFTGIHPRVICADFGWWFPESREVGLFGYDKANINCLTSARVPFDPILGTTQMRGLPCRLEKLDRN